MTASSPHRRSSSAATWSGLEPVFRDHRAHAYAGLARAFAVDPPPEATGAPLIVLQALRWAALQGRASDPWSGDPDAARRDLARLRPEVDAALARGLVQFTDPQRMTDLLPGLLLAASRCPGRPVRLVELGACAGLLLAPECYRIAYPRARWSPDAATVELASPLDVPPALLDAAGPDVVDRVGLDLAPVDPGTGYDYLRAFAWPGDPAREPRLAAALAAVAARDVRVLPGDLADLLPAILDAWVEPDVLTIVLESSVAPYLPPATSRRIGRLLDARAARGPLALVSRGSSRGGVLPDAVTVTDLSSRWRRAYAVSDALSERSAWRGDPSGPWTA